MNPSGRRQMYGVGGERSLAVKRELHHLSGQPIMPASATAHKSRATTSGFDPDCFYLMQSPASKSWSNLAAGAEAAGGRGH